MLEKKLPLISPTNHLCGKLFVDVSTHVVAQTQSDTQDVANTFDEYVVSVGGTAANKQSSWPPAEAACLTSHDPSFFPPSGNDASP